MNRQIPLRIPRRETFRLDDFLLAGNEHLIHTLRQTVLQGQAHYLFIWGSSGSGKTHLAAGTAEQATEQGLTSLYIDLSNEELEPAYLHDPGQLQLLCLDNLHCRSGDRQWETALFNLYNRLRESGASLICTADAPPEQLGCSLPDLTSRLLWGPVFEIQDCTDEDKVVLLQNWATQRGMKLEPDAAAYLLKQIPRSLGDTRRVLEDLDDACLAARRNPTIPFIREFLT